MNRMIRRFRRHGLLQSILNLLLASAVVLMIHSSRAASDGNSAAAFERLGDPISGGQVYTRCIGCHSLNRNRTGPKHCGLFGRKAGSAEGYQYSKAMAGSDIVWNAISLDKFIQAPLSTLPGTTMGFSGVKEDQERYDLIAYLMQASDSDACR